MAAIVKADFNRHTCIELSRQAGVVKFIPLDILGMEVREMSSQEFDRTYKPIEDYPVEKAAKLYAEYATQLGGTPEAMKALADIIPLTSKEIEMATAKKATSAKPETKSKPAAKSAKAPVVTKGSKAPAAKKEAGEKKPSAANMFKELIMEGKKTDDQIFAAVQKAFGLDDNKRSYVKWYRNDLTKKGMNPPAAK